MRSRGVTKGKHACTECAQIVKNKQGVFAFGLVAFAFAILCTAPGMSHSCSFSFFFVDCSLLVSAGRAGVVR